LRFYLCKIKGAGTWPNIVKQASGSNLRTSVIEDGQLPAG
jgi:hypothetical protein